MADPQEGGDGNASFAERESALNERETALKDREAALAKRAANSLGDMDQMTKMMELNRMKATNPQLYMLVIQILQSQQGSQANPLDASQSPLPEQRPTRRAAPVG